MNILQIYQDFSIPYQTEGHKHCRPGWVNTACPFCTGNPGLHLGASLDEGFFYCWRCGWHPQKEAISKILNVSRQEATKIIKEYSEGVRIFTPEPKIKIRKKAHKYPTDVRPLQKQHIRYLENRNFDAKYIEKEWSIKGTGPMSVLDGINYSRRIIVPIHWEGQSVTFQTRDITDRHIAKYMACPKERELIHHKDIIYGKQEKWTDTGICVEGITDVWRLGIHSFCTFGIKYKPKQLRIMSSLFKRIAVVFDDDPQAIKQADILVSDLLFRGVDAFRVNIKGDPGDMTDDDARHLVKSIIK